VCLKNFVRKTPFQSADKLSQWKKSWRVRFFCPTHFLGTFDCKISSFRPGLPDFSRNSIPKQGKIYQIITALPSSFKNLPNGGKIFQMTLKYTNIFHSKVLQNLPNLDFLVWKYTYHLATLLPTTEKMKKNRFKTKKKIRCIFSLPTQKVSNHKIVKSYLTHN
jgi:hypothetical protein